MGLTDWERAVQLGQCLRSNDAVLKGVNIPTIVHPSTTLVVNENQDAFLQTRFGKQVEYVVGVNGYEIVPPDGQPHECEPIRFRSFSRRRA